MKILSPIRFALPSLLVVAAILLPVTASQATERRFSFTEESTTNPQGTLELENWVTWESHHGVGNEDYDNLKLRHELEYGLTDHLQVSAYFDWDVLDDGERDHHVRFSDVALEAKLNLTNPVTDFIGSGLYGEVTIGDRLFELEGKLLLQKNIGKWIVAYNAVLEAEFEGAHLDERTGELGQHLGVSYEFNPHVSVGLELLHELEFPDWTINKHEKNALYAGPNASVRFGNVFATLTPLVQIAGESDEPDVQTRLIFGLHF